VRRYNEAAIEVGAQVILGDRPVGLTLARTWAALSTWERCSFLWTLLYSGQGLILVHFSAQLERFV